MFCGNVLPLVDVVTFPVSAINRCHCHITFSFKQPFSSLWENTKQENDFELLRTSMSMFLL